MYFSTMFLKMDRFVVKITTIIAQVALESNFTIDFFDNLCYNERMGLISHVF